MLTTKIVDSFYMRVKTALSDKKKSEQFGRIVSKYVDVNHEKLSAVGPTKRILFTDAEKQQLFDLLDIESSTVSSIIKNIPEVKRSANANNAFSVILTLVIRFYRITKNDQYRKMAYLYLILSMYPSIHTKYFKYEPNEQIMLYTMSTLSNKFKFKQQGTLIGTLAETAEVADEHFAKEIVRGNDLDIVNYIISVKTRLNALIKNICNEFMKQHESGNYLNYEEDNEDEENFKASDNNSFVIDRLSQSVALSLSVHGPNARHVTLAAEMTQVSINDLRNTVDKMCRDKKNLSEIKEVISAILYDFLFEGHHTKEAINSSEFIVYSLETYKKSNTINTNIVKIKKILDSWLAQYSKAYNKTNRIATLNLFRKAMYLFFIFTIQKTST